MYKKNILFYLIIIVVIMCSCQQTPSDPMVINKGDGKLEDTILNETVDSAQNVLTTENDVNEVYGIKTISEKWEEDLTMPLLKCDINAEITIPATNTYPVYKVQQKNFDDKIISRVIDYFTSDAIGVRETSFTKEELEELLIQTKRGRYMWDDNGGRWESYEGQEEEISELEEQINNAKPEAFKSITENAYTLPIDNTYEMPDGARVYINITEQRISIYPKKLGIFQPESWVIAGDAYPGEPKGTTLNNVKISEEEACNNVFTFLSELGIENFGIADAEKARIIKETYETIWEGWEVTLSRDDGNSIPAYINPSQITGILYQSSEDYVYHWPQEYMTIYVDEHGIKGLFWEDPIDVVEELNTNVPIKTFDEIKDMIRKYIKFAFSKNFEGVDVLEQQIELTKVVLTNVLVPIKDVPEYHMLVPAWIVYYEQENSIGVVTSIIAINAIDGSSIDLNFNPNI